MELLLWHGLAITTMIAVAFTLGYITGKQFNEQSTRKDRRIK